MEYKDNIVSLIETIEEKGGVQNGFVFKDREMIGTTFPGSMREKLLDLGKLVGMLFTVSKSMGSSYEEAYMFFEGLCLIAYNVDNNIILGFLADLEINISLLNSTVRSYVPRIKRLVARSHQSVFPEHIKTKIQQLRTELQIYLGPIAFIVFDDCLDRWKTQKDFSHQGLARLIQLVGNEIKEPRLRNAYLTNAEKIVLRGV